MVVLCPMSLGLCVEDDQCAAASRGDGMGDASRNDVKLAWTYREWQSFNCEIDVPTDYEQTFRVFVSFVGIG